MIVPSSFIHLLFFYIRDFFFIKVSKSPKNHIFAKFKLALSLFVLWLRFIFNIKLLFSFLIYFAIFEIRIYRVSKYMTIFDPIVLWQVIWENVNFFIRQYLLIFQFCLFCFFFHSPIKYTLFKIRKYKKKFITCFLF